MELVSRLPRIRLLRRVSVALALVGLLALAVPGSVGAAKPTKGPFGNFKHLVVIYEENHSFDNLYGLWGDVNGQHLIGLADADCRAHHADRAGRHHVHVPEAARRQPQHRTAGQRQTGGPLGNVPQQHGWQPETVTRGDGTHRRPTTATS